MTPLKIACIGEAMIELSPDETGRHAAIGYAGDTLNTAIYLKRNLASGHSVYFQTCLGHDSFSNAMIDYISAESINCEHIAKHNSRLPGVYAISKDDTGDRVFSYWRENSAARTLFQLEDGSASFSSLSGMDIIYLSAITLAILPERIVAALFEWIADFRKNGGRFAFDSNYRPKLWPDKVTAQDAVSRAWGLSDIALPSIDDEMALFEDADEDAAFSRLASYGTGVMAVKRGAKGPVAIIDGSQIKSDKIFKSATTVVDTTAAGDSFNGAFLASFLSGNSVDEAVAAGHDMAVKVIAHQGAIIPK